MTDPFFGTSSVNWDISLSFHNRVIFVDSIFIPVLITEHTITKCNNYFGLLQLICRCWNLKIQIFPSSKQRTLAVKVSKAWWEATLKKLSTTSSIIFLLPLLCFKTEEQAPCLAGFCRTPWLHSQRAYQQECLDLLPAQYPIQHFQKKKKSFSSFDIRDGLSLSWHEHHPNCLLWCQKKTTYASLNQEVVFSLYSFQQAT